MNNITLRAIKSLKVTFDPFPDYWAATDVCLMVISDVVLPWHFVAHTCVLQSSKRTKTCFVREVYVLLVIN